MPGLKVDMPDITSAVEGYIPLLNTSGDIKVINDLSREPDPYHEKGSGCMLCISLFLVHEKLVPQIRLHYVYVIIYTPIS